jgi:hypothetical protein
MKEALEFCDVEADLLYQTIIFISYKKIKKSGFIFMADRKHELFSPDWIHFALDHF